MRAPNPQSFSQRSPWSTLAVLGMLTLSACGTPEDNTGTGTDGGSTTPAPTPPGPVTLTDSEKSSLPTSVSGMLEAGEAKAYRTRMQVDLGAAYPQSAQENLFYLSEMANDPNDPTEFFLALSVDYWCCDKTKWGGSNQTQCYDNRELEYCTSASSQDCYLWGSATDFTSAGAGLTGYCVNETVGPCFPCKDIQENFSAISNTAKGLVETNLGVTSATVSGLLNGFISAMKKPTMGALLVVDSSGEVVFTRVESFIVSNSGTDSTYTLPASSRPFMTGTSGSMTLPVGNASVRLLNDVVLPAAGIKDGVAELITKTIVDNACSHAPTGTKTMCKEKITEFATDKVEALLEGMAEKVKLQVSEVNLTGFAVTGGSFSMTVSGSTLSGTYKVVSGN